MAYKFICITCNTRGNEDDFEDGVCPECDVEVEEYEATETMSQGTATGGIWDNLIDEEGPL